MEEITEVKPRPLSFALQYGLFLGIGLIALDYIYYAMGVPYQDKIRYISLLVLFAGVIFIGRHYRKTMTGGYISYGSAFGLVFLTALFAYLLQSFNTFAMMKYFIPEMLNDILMQTETKLLEASPNITDEELDAAMAMSQKMMGPGWLALWGFLGSVISALLVSVIASFFVKKKDPNAINI